MRVPTEVLTREFVEYIRAGAPVEAACKIAGIDDEEYAQWQEKAKAGDLPYATFMACLRRAEGEQGAEAAAAWSAKFASDWKAAAEFLKVRYPKRWAPKTKAEVTFEGEPPKTYISIDLDRV